MTIFEEKAGVFSMRRALALYYALLSGACLVISTLNGAMAGVYAGIGAMVCVLILLGLTTMQDLREITQYKIADAISGIKIDEGLNDNAIIGFKPKNINSKE